MLLALDTSAKLAGIALYDGEAGLIAEQIWHSANRHTEELMPQVAQMLAQAGVRPAALRAVAAALGPGSFTGLRVALAAAKGLALANGLALLGVPTLDVVAYPHQRQPLSVVAIVQAGRGRVCWAPYRHGPNGWAAQTPYSLSTVAALGDAISSPTLFAGELLPATRATLAERLRDLAHFLPPALSLRRAGYLAEIAWGRYVAGQADDLATLCPIYLHQPAEPKE
jgi:tRNA threonylcarbamoyladenosine biosynthesis protein TsaB